MAQLVDLTLPVAAVEDGHATVATEEWALQSAKGPYTGMVYRFNHGSMSGSYIDFPGHIKETDDGADAANFPIEDLFRIEADVIRLDRDTGSGAVTAPELAAACRRGTPRRALVINALGRRRFDAIEERSVFLRDDAVEWIVRRNVRLLVSDIYESKGVHGVFRVLFENRIATVCFPINLDRLVAPRVRLTVLFLRLPGVTQLPCRIVAEVKQPRPVAPGVRLPA
ncbi:MAG: hypothetical protein A3K19_00245 [Lentisphaerae bacterium RIFOXYB12_FULL_65_16]|nr:MAG: hypothetical protein A3K18_04860 [Lentisphaerae bacterium RIFOXYA12_64_32]OGV85403.1 MAG: hypothetical protein A3K19_00245 [Lentisphaerae bacterium RIFOXYB12_FULL_65_16]